MSSRRCCSTRAERHLRAPNTGVSEAHADNLYFPPERGEYTYFDASCRASGTSHPEESHQDAPQFAAMSRAADASMLAYARYGHARMQEAEFREILHRSGFTDVYPIGDFFVDNASSARGFFAANGERALLAFRGTEKGNFFDLAADADVLPANDEDMQAYVHRGFHRYFESVWPEVVGLVKNYRNVHPRQDICITGHSLGGALASLAFAHLCDPATSLYTFGCPRVGDRAFCERIETAAKTQQCWRIVDHLDIVTHVPLHGGYEHPRIGTLWIDSKGELTANTAKLPDDQTGFGYMFLGLVNTHLPWLFSKWLPRPLADHSPARYCHWVAQAIETSQADSNSQRRS